MSNKQYKGTEEFLEFISRICVSDFKSTYHKLTGLEIMEIQDYGQKTGFKKFWKGLTNPGLEKKADAYYMCRIADAYNEAKQLRYLKICELEPRIFQPDYNNPSWMKVSQQYDIHMIKLNAKEPIVYAPNPFNGYAAKLDKLCKEASAATKKTWGWQSGVYNFLNKNLFITSIDLVTDYINHFQKIIAKEKFNTVKKSMYNFNVVYMSKHLGWEYKTFEQYNAEWKENARKFQEECYRAHYQKKEKESQKANSDDYIPPQRRNYSANEKYAARLELIGIFAKKGIASSRDDKELKAAFRQYMKIMHTDKTNDTGATEELQIVNHLVDIALR